MASATIPPLPDITLPAHGVDTVRGVLNGFMRVLAQDLLAVPAAKLTPPTRAIFGQAMEVARTLLRSDPRKIVPILRQPTHAALLVTALYESGPDGDAAKFDARVRELALLLLFELSVQGTLPATGVTVQLQGAPFPPLRSIGARVQLDATGPVESIAFLPLALVVRTKMAEFKTDPRSGEVPADAPLKASRPYLPIVDGVVLALTDNNPLSHFEAHPDKQGNTLDLGGKPAEEWAAVLRECFALVDQYLPLLGQEMRHVLRLIVPVGFEPEKHLSASYKEAVGTIYMTLHPNAMTMLEALVHEFQHNKLNAALHLDPLLHNGFHPLYTSPVRPDPRPLHGVVLAVHAFQPIARLYEQMDAAKHPWSANPSWQKRFRDIIRMNRAGAETVLANAQPTPGGQPFFDEMRALDAAFRTYEAAHWTDEAKGPAQALPE